MSEQEKDMVNRIKRLEDNLLRSKDFKEQVRISHVLLGYRKRLQELKCQNYE